MLSAILSGSVHERPPVSKVALAVPLGLLHETIPEMVFEIVSTPRGTGIWS